MPVQWSEFKTSSPALATSGEKRLHGRLAYLATIRKDGSPHVFPVSPFSDGTHLWIFVSADSPKRFDLINDGRYSLHCQVEDNQGGNGEFQASGKAVRVVHGATRAAAEAVWPGSNPIKDDYLLFELLIESVIHTVYEDRKPIRTRWNSNQVRA